MLFLGQTVVVALVCRTVLWCCRQGRFGMKTLSWVTQDLNKKCDSKKKKTKEKKEKPTQAAVFSRLVSLLRRGAAEPFAWLTCKRLPSVRFWNRIKLLCNVQGVVPAFPTCVCTRVTSAASVHLCRAAGAERRAAAVSAHVWQPPAACWLAATCSFLLVCSCQFFWSTFTEATNFHL